MVSTNLKLLVIILYYNSYIILLTLYGHELCALRAMYPQLPFIFYCVFVIAFVPKHGHPLNHYFHNHGQKTWQ